MFPFRLKVRVKLKNPVSTTWRKNRPASEISNTSRKVVGATCEWWFFSSLTSLLNRRWFELWWRSLSYESTPWRIGDLSCGNPQSGCPARLVIHILILVNQTLDLSSLVSSPLTTCLTAIAVFGRPFVKRFAVCYRTVVCPVCPTLSVCPVCNVGALWPNSWTDQDETWHAGRPRPRPHGFRWGPSAPSPKGAQPPIFCSCPLWPNGWMD